MEGLKKRLDQLRTADSVSMAHACALISVCARSVSMAHAMARFALLRVRLVPSSLCAITTGNLRPVRPAPKIFLAAFTFLFVEY